MFKVNGNPILADDLGVLLELKRQLEKYGILRFNEFKVGTSNIQFNCPIHNEGQERKPSCGISTVNKKDVQSGTVHCFTCGYTVSLEEMISNCFGKNDNGEFGRQWLIKNFLTVAIEDRKILNLDLGRENNNSKSKFISEKELDSYRYYHDYMYKRKLTNEIIDKFDIGYDPKFNLVDKFGKVKSTLECITFPVRNEEGNTLFIGRRAINIKLFHYPEGVEKPVYGLYELPKDADEIIICESFFNTLTSYVYGKPSLALIGLGTEFQYNQLRRLKARKLITAFDPDNAGMKATERLKKAMKGFKIVTSLELPPKKDINDLTLKEFLNLDEIF